MSSKQLDPKEGHRIRLKATGAIYQLLTVNSDTDGSGLYIGGGRGPRYTDGGNTPYPSAYIPNKTVVAHLYGICNPSFWESADDPFVQFVREVLEAHAHD